MAADLGQFYRDTVEPLLFPLVGTIFNDFTPHGREWRSPLCLDGSRPDEPRADKTVIADPATKRYSHLRALEHSTAMTSMDLLELYKLRNGVDFRAAVEALAAAVGKEIPKGTPDEEQQAQQRREQQRQLVSLLGTMKEALYTPAAAAELAYLREGRGYSDEYIKSMPIGFFDASAASTAALCRLLRYTDKGGEIHEGVKTDRQWGIGYTHRIAIAYISEGEIRGFTFRTADPTVKKPKYLTAPIGEKDTQYYYPFALPVGRCSEYTLVEGPLDTYRALPAGIPNVIGMAQGTLSTAALERLKRHGATMLTILKDTEDTAEGRERNRRSVIALVNAIHAQGLSAYVAYLPAPEGQKVDLDEYLRGYNGDALQEKGREVQALLDAAEDGYIFLYRDLEDTYRRGPRGDKQRNALLHGTLMLCSHIPADSTATATIASLYKEATGAPLPMTAPSPTMATMAAPSPTIPSPTMTAAGEGTPSPTDEASALEQVMVIETDEERRQRRAKVIPGISLPYTLYSSERGREICQRLFLRAGAISYVCMPTSHGKTRLLQNMALTIAADEPQGTAVFFTVEESADEIEDEFVNIYYTLHSLGTPPDEITSELQFYHECLRTHISDTPLDTIRLYYAAGSDRAAAAKEFYDERHFNHFERRRKDFYSTMVDTRRLMIVSEESQTMEAIAAKIQHICRAQAATSPVKAVFIDHLHRLRKKGFKGSRKEELTAITDELISLAKATQVPIVVAAQLIRSTYSPIDMDVQNISDACEIEQSGNLVLLCWNSAIAARKGGTYYRTSKEGKTDLSDEAFALEQRTGIHLGEPGSLYMIAAKNRGSIRNGETHLYYDGGSGLIIQGDRPTPPRKAKEQAHRYTMEEGRASFDAFRGRKKRQPDLLSDDDAPATAPY